MKIKNATGLPQDTKVIVGKRNVTKELSVAHIGIDIDARGKLTATLTCYVEECDVSVLPENVKVAMQTPQVKVEADVGYDLGQEIQNMSDAQKAELNKSING